MRKGVEILQRISIFSCLIFVLIAIECVAKEKITEEDYRAYFKGLDYTEQKQAIKDIATDMRKSLPMDVDEYRQWEGVLYIDDANVLVKIFKFNIDYDKIDKSVIPEFKEANRINSINSICTGSLFKTWLFEADLTIRNNFIMTTGQNLFHYSISKSDCIDAGYRYP